MFNIETYYVENGLLNGEPGVYAKTSGFGHQQPDGWYYLPMEADDGVGPYPTREAAIAAAADDK